MLRFLSTVLAVFLGLFLFTFFVVAVLVSAAAGTAAEKPLPGSVVLEMDARQAISDAPSGLAMPASFGGPSLSVVGIVEALQQAKSDSAVKGLYIRTDSSLGIEPGEAEEIRDAVMDFKSSGKFVISQVEDLSEPGLGGYFLASAADQVWLQPSGLVFAQGVGAQLVYFKGLLDKLYLSADELNYHEYKSAYFPFIHTEPTDAEREETMSEISNVFASFTGEIAKSRKMTADQFTALLNGGPYTSEEALKSGWVDKLGYDVDAEDAAKNKAGADASIVDLGDYARAKGNPYKSGAVIALIEGQGEIVDGDGDQNPFASTRQFGGDAVSKAILDAAQNTSVKAIVFRVNSPGGSPTAADQVWNAVERARAGGKPVVVDMAGVAASGGYWVAMGANKIIAEPSTFTGSIGVVGMKVVTKALTDKIGVNVANMSEGGDKMFMLSSDHSFTPEEWDAFHKIFDATYNSFVQKVADGRKLPLDTVQNLAKGRVWMGSDAKTNGLVDEIGGLKTAIAAAKDLAHIAPNAPVELRSFPAEKTFFEALFETLGASAQAAHTLGVVADALNFAPTSQIIDALREEEALSAHPVQARMMPAQIH